MRFRARKSISIRRLVKKARSADVASSGPDDPLVRGFAEFGLPPSSVLVEEDQLDDLEAWRDNLRIAANSAFLDGTLLVTVDALLGRKGPEVLTPVTLWELTAFIDALVCFDRLYCIANPTVDYSRFNRRLGEDVLTVIPDPDGGMLRRLAVEAAADGTSNMNALRAYRGEKDDVFAQEVQAVVDGWRATLGSDITSDGIFNAAWINKEEVRSYGSSGTIMTTYEPYDPAWNPSAIFVEGRGYEHLYDLIATTRLQPIPSASSTDRPSLRARQNLAAAATYRTYINQGVSNVLGLPYLPATLRMPFRRLFVERASEVQDELVSVTLANQAFAQRQPSSPLILPFFTASVLQQATTRKDIWKQMARVRRQSAPFRRVRADLDRMLERSQVSGEAQRVQSAIRDEALKLADLAGAGQQASSVALGVVAQTGIVPLAGALKAGVDAAQGLGRGGSWTRIWRRLFHRHEYFLAQTNSQAIALTNALPQVQQLWDMPKIGGYLNHFASATQQIGHTLRD
jgi:hypothetical protein